MRTFLAKQLRSRARPGVAGTDARVAGPSSRLPCQQAALSVTGDSELRRTRDMEGGGAYAIGLEQVAMPTEKLRK